MKRRRFLEITAAGALALGVPGAAWRRPPSATLRLLTQPDLCAMLGHDRVRALGLRYRQACPAENKIETLRAAILGDDRPGLWPRSDLSNRLARQVRDDFEVGRTMLLDGWMLSITEARQCALFTLVNC